MDNGIKSVVSQIESLAKEFEQKTNSLANEWKDQRKNEFYSKVKEKCVKNYKNNDDVTLTRQQIIDIVVEIKKDSKKSVNVKPLDGLFEKTKFGTFSLN